MVNAVAIFAINVLSLYNLALAQPSGTQCPPVAGKPSCACQPPGEAIIDLSELSNSDGTPRFPKVGPDSSGYTYGFNPCRNFSEKQKCQNVHICQYTPDGQHFYEIAAGNTEQIWIDDDGKKYLHYVGPEFPQVREAYVYLECDRTATQPIITTTGDSEVLLQYKFYLKSCHSCPGGCNIAPPGPTLCPPILGEPPCKCQHPDGIIDLTPLASLNGTARFTGILTESNFSYSYNPCQGFQQGSSWNVHVCRGQAGFNGTTPIAEVGTEAIYYESGGVAHVHYRGPGQLQTKVYLECDQEAKNPVITTVEDAHCPLIFEFTVRSCQVCPRGCKEQKL